MIMMEKNKTTTIFSSFTFLKLQPEFRRLVSNEKMSNKQDFENAVANSQDKVFLRTYMTSGLRADSELMIWIMSDKINKLQDLSARLFTVGLGTYLTPTHSFLGICDINNNC